jgi:hypothetical protein
MTESRAAAAASSAVKLRKVATHPGIRALAWSGDVLYGCRGYRIVRMRVGKDAGWEAVARFHPAWWRKLTSRVALASRLVRDGFHALVVLDDQTMVGAVPGAIVTLAAGGGEFEITHRVRRGTRPLHLAATPAGAIYWGEYFDNRERAEVCIYGSTDGGRTWRVAYTFPAGSIRHVHNIIYDGWGDCLWILTGDEGAECKVLRAACDLSSVDVAISGNQQARAVAAVPTENRLYFSTDTPLEKNHVYRLDRRLDHRLDRRPDRAGAVEQVGDLASSSIYGCRVGGAIFFSTMVEPSAVNTGREVHLVGSRVGGGKATDWQVLARWKKDGWPMRYFQYGNAFLPDGENTTHYLAATTIAVEREDLVTTLWEVEAA